MGLSAAVEMTAQPCAAPSNTLSTPTRALHRRYCTTGWPPRSGGRDHVQLSLLDVAAPPAGGATADETVASLVVTGSEKLLGRLHPPTLEALTFTRYLQRPR